MTSASLPACSAPLPWHAPQWARVTGQRESEQLPHALLLAGPTGSGKSLFALALARTLLCASPSAGLNCGQCHACELSAAGNHGDFLWVEPQEKSRFIRIEQVRRAIEFTHGTASFGEAKVLVFAPGDSLNVNGFNALLKSLEEPSGGTHVILVCDRLHAVPATIRSRCQMLRLPAPTRSESLHWLDGSLGEVSEAERLLELTGGSPILARRLAESGTADSVLKRRLALHAVLSGDARAPQVWNLWNDSEPHEFLHELALELRQFVRLLPVQTLRGKAGKAAFSLLDEVGNMQRAVSAGANPGKQLLIDRMLSKCNRELGAVYLGDSI
tara:strand:+ start:21062 stop:22045 length:984 start_codon:yes stop_codon:yes gene_type:complete